MDSDPQADTGTPPTETKMPMPDLSQTRFRTIHALLDGYASLKPSELLKPLSPDFTYSVLPSSLGMRDLDREAFGLHAAGVFSVFDQFRMVPSTMYEDEKRGVVVIQARMEGKLKARHAGRGEWSNECVIIVRLSDAGGQVVQIQEFVDSSKAMEMQRRHGHAEGAFAPLVGGERRSWLASMVLFMCGLVAGGLVGVRRLLLAT
ncbi:hypothetical protein N656DRAFT_376467 [Canariomyces notabilis]|uniref:SnoaL-like domain-containing protein n=1 Tax=Canariomyces notabilis TaxID=2074819 RepID=A0AAN6QEN3_9PEZI|nr:hypothetical protein N656DRAFT_376467 [Canariomyces arenarius]